MSSELQPYARYKDSGVEWLGEVPEHWQVVNSKRYFRHRNERAARDDVQLTASQKYGIISQKRFSELENQRVMQVIRNPDILKKVRPNDFVISMRSFQGGLELSRIQGSISSAYVTIEPTEQTAAEYYRWAFKSTVYVQALQSTSNLVRDGQALRFENFAQVTIPLPPFPEQHAIADYLDAETGRIDTLISEQRELIELLKEKRQALISHCVTRGLDPDVPMKDSGVEWLGEVPEHWTVARLKHVTDLIVDCPHETPTYDPDGDYPVVRTADIELGALDPAEMFRLSEAEFAHRTRRAPLLKNDIVYSREGERWGHAALIPESNRYCLGQRMMQFRVNEDASPSFLMWLLNSQSVRAQGELDTVGATSPHVNISTIRNFSLSLPEKREQHAIADYLDAETARIDALIKEAEETISLMQEHRSALISACVTGKVQVPRVADPAAEEQVV